MTRKYGPRGMGTIRANGYVQIKAHGHPVAGLRGFAFQHRVVLYDSIGPGTHPCHWCSIPVTWGESLESDHLDHDRANNDPANLVPSCMPCNRSRWNREKTECPNGHGPYDKAYANGWRYCSRCKCEKESRRRARVANV